MKVAVAVGIVLCVGAPALADTSMTWLKAERVVKKEKGLDRTAPEPSKPASGSNGQKKGPGGKPAAWLGL
jgi:hypothetical protein